MSLLSFGQPAFSEALSSFLTDLGLAEIADPLAGVFHHCSFLSPFGRPLHPARSATDRGRATAAGFRSREELAVAKLAESDLKELGIGMKARKKLLKAIFADTSMGAMPSLPEHPALVPPTPQCEAGAAVRPDGTCALPSADWLKRLLEDEVEMSSTDIEDVAGILHRADFGSVPRLLFGGGDNFMADGSSATNEGIPVTGSQLRELGVKNKAHRKAITKALAQERRLRKEDKAAADRAHILVAKRNVRPGKPQEELTTSPAASTAVATKSRQQKLAWPLRSVDNELGGPLFSRHYGANPPVRQRLLRPGFASAEETSFLAGAVTHALQGAPMQLTVSSQMVSYALRHACGT